MADYETYSKNSSLAAREYFGFEILLRNITSGAQQSGDDHLIEHVVHGRSGRNDVKK